MSAFICNNETINAITYYVFANPYAETQFIKLGLGKMGIATPREFGQALYRMNSEAVNNRYQEQEEPPLFKYRATEYPGNIAAYKATRILLYQCHEGNVPDSELYRLLSTISVRIADDIISAMPEYDAIEWA